MTTTVTAAIMLMLSGCASGEERQQEALMERIEAQVRLPAGARQLHEYARYYALRENGHVEGVYRIPRGQPRPDESCEELMPNFTSVEVPCPDTEGALPEVPAGERLWVDDYRNLPFISDGGCTIVNVLFDRTSGRIREVACNGPE
jgi:hypothetical protein